MGRTGRGGREAWPTSSKTSRRSDDATTRRIPTLTPEGFVAMPNVDAPEEMVDMLSATRAYQANLTAIGLIREMVQKALELGR